MGSKQPSYSTKIVKRELPATILQHKETYKKLKRLSPATGHKIIGTFGEEKTQDYRNFRLMKSTRLPVHSAEKGLSSKKVWVCFVCSVPIQIVLSLF